MLKHAIGNTADLLIALQFTPSAAERSATAKPTPRAVPSARSLPIVIWQEVAKFASPRDVWRLEQVERAARAGAHCAVTRLTIPGKFLAQKISANNRFPHLRALRVSLCCTGAMRDVVASLAAFHATRPDSGRSASLALTLETVATFREALASTQAEVVPSLSGLPRLRLTHLTLIDVPPSAIATDERARLTVPVSVEINEPMRQNGTELIDAALAVPTLQALRIKAALLLLPNVMLHRIGQHPRLESVTFTGSTTQAMSLGILAGSRSITELSLGQQVGPNPAAAQALATLPSLRRMSGQWRMSSDVMIALTQTATGFEMLDLKLAAASWCPCHDALAVQRQAVQSLVSLPSLKSLYLEAIRGDVAALDDTHAATIAAKSWRALSLIHINMTPRVSEVIAGIRVEALELVNSSMQYSPRLLSVLQENRSLRYLRISALPTIPGAFRQLTMHPTLTRLTLPMPAALDQMARWENGECVRDVLASWTAHGHFYDSFALV